MSTRGLLRAVGCSSSEGRTPPRGFERAARSFRAFALIAATFAAVEGHARADGASATDEARNHFRAGVTLLQDPDGARFEEAYREFKTAYEIAQSPKILGNVGYCALKLERDQEAIDAYERYLKEAPDIDAGERKQVEGDLLTLKSGLVRVDLTIEGPAASIVDKRVPTRGEPIVNGYGTATGHVVLGVRQGRHVVEVKLGEGQPLTWQFDAMPGGHFEHAFAPIADAPVAVAGPPSRALPITLTTLGLAALAGGAVTGIVALVDAKRISNSCPNDLCPSGYGLDGQRSTTTTLVHTTDILLIGGGVVAATGLGWLIFSKKPSSPSATAMCTGTGCGAMLRGNF